MKASQSLQWFIERNDEQKLDPNIFYVLLNRLLFVITLSENQ